MIKKFLFSLCATAGILSAHAQSAQKHCYSDEVLNQQKLLHPNIAVYEQQLEEQFQRAINKLDANHLGKTTQFDGTTIYDIPVVVHVVHNYGNEYLTDNQIFDKVDDWTRVYMKQDDDTGASPYGTIAPYHVIANTGVPYIGKANIRFHLASKDPQGKPTHGITRTYSALSGNAGDQAKLEYWPPSSYVNIWIINRFDENHEGAAAYATPPASAADQIYGDGVITLYDYFFPSTIGGQPNKTVEHEIGHIFNLQHPWGNTNSPGVACGDDGVDDTPPTKGHGDTVANNSGCTSRTLFDTTCAVVDSEILARPFETIHNIPKGDTLNYPSIDFKAFTNLTLNSVTIYPTAPVGTPYTITLRKYGMTINQSSGLTTTDSSAMVVNLGFAIATDSGYSLVLTTNPKALRDSGLTNYPDSVANVLSFVNDNFNGRYNYFYDWHITAGTNSVTIGKPQPGISISSLTNVGIKFKTRTRVIIQKIDVFPTARVGAPFTIVLKNHTGATVRSYSDTVKVRYALQAVPLNWNLTTADTAYHMVFSQNPGMLRDSDSYDSYNRFVPGAIAITGDSSGGFYNYFYNWDFLYGYFKIYANDSLVDYPDTVNSQNIMDYTYCDRMFTTGQTVRMRTALTSDVAGRSNLWSNHNLYVTGTVDTLTHAALPRLDLKPIPDFSASANNNSNNPPFVSANGTTTVTLKNRSWNDTLTALSWNVSNGASLSSSSSLTQFNTSFTQPGWVTVSMTATGNNTGDSTVSFNNRIYAADTNGVNPIGYFEDFNPGTDLDKWPIFNYYNTDFRWELAGTGFYDLNSIRFKNFDNRQYPDYLTASPRGQYADFFTRAFDLSDPSFITNCNINFFSAGVSKTTIPAEMHDTLEIAYTLDGANYTKIDMLTGSQLANNGTYSSPYAPGWQGEWAPHSTNIPTAIRGKKHVFFRFRYKVGVSLAETNTSQGSFAGPHYYEGTGNNFYLDRLFLSNDPLAVYNQMANETGIALAPNPTSGSALLTIKGSDNSTAQIQVTDIAGKVVYRTQAQLNGKSVQVEIPASAIAVRGMYLVQVSGKHGSQTQKLVVY